MTMQSSRCFFSTATALHRIFIAPIEHSRVLPALPFPIPRARRLNRNSVQHLSSAYLPTAKRRLPRDDEIRASMVLLVSDGDNKLSSPQYTSSILSSMDRMNETLVVVALPDPDDDSDGAYPICRILSKKVLRETDKARRKKKDLPSTTVKTVELNWAIDQHDLQHRLQRVKDFLIKGWRVDVVMAGKKRGRKATPEEARILMSKIRGAMREVEGSREWRDMEGGDMGGSPVGATTIYLVGKTLEEEMAL